VGPAVGAAVGENVTHTFDSQRPPIQSESSTHVSPISHPGHDVPPQSTKVSSPFKEPSRHDNTVGPTVGRAVGVVDGAAVGVSVGADVGTFVGDTVGATDGDPVGAAVGFPVGTGVGDVLGVADGDAVGLAVGTAVGDTVLGAEQQSAHRLRSVDAPLSVAHFE
jgi:hypothetical protein